MKKIVIISAIVFAVLCVLVVAGILWDNYSNNKEAEQRKADASFYAEQNAKINEANRSREEYDKSVGR